MTVVYKASLQVSLQLFNTLGKTERAQCIGLEDDTLTKHSKLASPVTGYNDAIHLPIQLTKKGTA